MLSCHHLQYVRLKRRDYLCIIADMLDIAKHGAKKTQIMYKANLSFTQLGDYLTFLTENGLLRRTIIGGNETYTTTRKGLDFLKTHDQLIHMLERHDSLKNALVI